MQRVLLDTGPLVALMVDGDPHHKTCLELSREFAGPLCSCWAVITEAAWLLREYPLAIRNMLTALSTGFAEMLPLQSNEAGRIREIMERYSNLRPQLADATLVYLAEREGIDTIFTLNRRDFSVYRIGGKRPFNIIPESK
jgi:predicted nucleic acid-binding protein